jgi:hypothetical protein
MISYEELVLDFENGVLGNLPGTPLIVESNPERFAFQPILIRNNNRNPMNISMSFASLDGLNGVEIENNCPPVLSRKQYCYVSIFVNRNESMAESTTLSQENLTMNLDGQDFNLPVQGQTTVATDLDALSQTDIELSSTLLDYSTVYEGDDKTKLIILKNNSNRRELPINKDISALTIADESFSTCPVEGVLKRRSACFISFTLKSSLATNNYSETISLAGKDVTLSAVVDPQPVYSSNLDVSYLKNASYTFNDLANEFVITVTNDTRENQSLYYDFFPILSSQGLSGLDYPSAFSLDDGCLNKEVVRETSCYLQMSFDPERFHFGVSFEKTISFNDEAMTLSFEGTSPCSDPGSSMYQPGTKLSQDKKSCIPNLRSI